MKKPTEPPKVVDNVGDPDQVAKGRTKAEILDARAVDRWTRLLADEDNRLVVWEILEFCESFQSALGANDAATNYNVGKQDVGHFVLAQINKARPNALIEMMLENAKEKSL